MMRTRPLAMLLAIGVLLTGCAGGPRTEGDVLEEELVALLNPLDDVDEAAVTWTPTVVRVSVRLDDRDSCASRAAAATSVAEAFTETDHSVHTPRFTFRSGQDTFTWVHFDPDFTARYTAATTVWCSYLDNSARDDAAATTDFVRGAEIGLALTAADDAAAAALTAEVTAVASNAGLLARPGGISVTVSD